MRVRSRFNDDDLLDGGRKRMVQETGAFLTWALKHPDQVPGIPKRPVNAGGFDRLMRQPGARGAINRWWDAFLDKVSD